MESSMSKKESVVGERRILRSTYSSSNLKSDTVKVDILDEEDDVDDHSSYQDKPQESECDKGATLDVAGMFVNVKMEMNDIEFYEEEQGSDEQEEPEPASCMNGHSNMSVNWSLPSDSTPRPKGIIAKLAQKLNSKLNSVFTPRPTDDLLACLEPEVSVATLGAITSGGVFVCPWCPFTASHPETLEEHKHLCHRLPSGDGSQIKSSKSNIICSGSPERPHTCEECGKTFARSWHLKRHYIIHTGERPFICVHCGEGFATGNDLKIHHREHSGERPFQCKHCAETFTTSGEVKTHMRIHIEERPFGCSVCGERFLHSSNLKVHCRTHVDECKPFICKDCGKAFASCDNLVAHERTHSNESSDDKATCCKQCGESINGKEKLKHHMQMHAGDKPYLCPLCCKSFTQSYTMKSHVRNKHMVQMMDALESSDDCFICLHCKNEFNDVNSLKCHMKAHSGEKRYKCYDCGESFRGANDLKVHIRIHTGERPFICPECGESFTQKGNLTVHIRTHTGEKPFECQVCGRCFLKSSNLKEHMKVHQEGRVKRIGPAPRGRPTRFVTHNEALLSSREKNFLKETHIENVHESTILPSGGDKNSFRDTIAERLKEAGILSFGGGKIQLQLLKEEGE